MSLRRNRAPAVSPAPAPGYSAAAPESGRPAPPAGFLPAAIIGLTGVLFPTTQNGMDTVCPLTTVLICRLHGTLAPVPISTFVFIMRITDGMPIQSYSDRILLILKKPRRYR